MFALCQLVWMVFVLKLVFVSIKTSWSVSLPTCPCTKFIGINCGNPESFTKIMTLQKKNCKIDPWFLEFKYQCKFTLMYYINIFQQIILADSQVILAQFLMKKLLFEWKESLQNGVYVVHKIGLFWQLSWMLIIKLNVDRFLFICLQKDSCVKQQKFIKKY